MKYVSHVMTTAVELNKTGKSTRECLVTKALSEAVTPTKKTQKGGRKTHSDICQQEDRIAIARV